MTLLQLKSLQHITDILNDFLEPFDCTAAPDTDFAYYTASNTISYALTFADCHEKTFMNFVHNLFPLVHANIFLWSFFHELGHHETEDDFEDREWKKYRKDITKCTTDEEYYNLPIEYAATYWAGEYLTNHIDEVIDLWNKLIPVIKNFYSVMEVDCNEA